MASVVVTHGVGNMDVWLKKAAEREKLFAPFASSYRVYKEKELESRRSRQRRRRPQEDGSGPFDARNAGGDESPYRA